MNNEELFKEIDLIQGCISRMANNSFLVKGWALSLIAGVTVFTNGENFDNLIFLLTTIVPFVCFWVLDAFFLQTEKKYRAMYSDRLKKRKNGDDDQLFELEPNKYNVNCVFRLMFSITLVVFYCIPILAIVIGFIIKMIQKV